MIRFKTLFFVLSLFFLTTTFAQNKKILDQSQSAATKEWTFLVFVNGHNNLSPFATENIIDMEKVGSSDEVNVLVEWGSATSNITKRLYIEKSKNPAKVTSPSLMEMKNYDMGNYKNLQEFIRWGVEKYPAKHYFISVWNHGAGWHKNAFSPFSFKPTDISFDDNTGNLITTEQMGLVMAESKKIIGHNVDIYGSDACLMQMLEVAGEMKESTDYFVGSQENEPGEGWPYLPFLKKWTANPKMTPAEISVLLSKEYAAAYAEGGIYATNGPVTGITFSAWDMSKLDGVYTALIDFGRNLNTLSATDLKSVKQAAKITQRFSKEDYADLGDFLKNTRNLNLPAIEPLVLDNLEARLNDLVLTTDNNQIEFAKATGVSVWLPILKNTYQARYNKLQFSLATGWNIFTNRLATSGN